MSTSITRGLKSDWLARLAGLGQEHLLQFWDELGDEPRHQLAHQLAEIDFELIASLAYSSDSDADSTELAERASSPPAITLNDFADEQSYQQAIQIGSEALAAGNVGMILVAGGQGTRLGFDLPKGMYPIGPLSGRTLYQMHIDQLVARGRQFGTRIPLYVMTSPATHDDTVNYFHQHQNFGLPVEDLRPFCQGTMPAIDLDGRLILEAKHRLFTSPDGHGGMLGALERSGWLKEIVERGIKHLFYIQVDNPLAQVCHPALLGYHLQHRSEMTTQVVRKQDPLQRVGNVVAVDGRVQIIEYSDLPESHARQTNPDGSLKFWAGSIAVHIFETEFLQRSLANRDSLPFHRALKKVPFVDAAGNLVQPDQPNAIKFERFIFDLLPWAGNSIVCEVDPAEGFCAVKNAPPASAETPAHVRQAIGALHRRWLRAAGTVIAPEIEVEIHPGFAVDAERLKQVLPPGLHIAEPTYFKAIEK